MPLAGHDPETLQSIDQAWAAARLAGALGQDSIEFFYAHATGYILTEWRTKTPSRAVDCGTGAGLPGLLLALEMPESNWWLVDAQARRCDLARRAVAAAGLTSRVTVKQETIEETACSHRESFDAAVARSFGPPAELAECALPLIKIGSALVVSVSEATLTQWRELPLQRLGCEAADTWTTPQGRYLAIKRIEASPDEFPRRHPARRRAPLGQPRCFT